MPCKSTCKNCEKRKLYCHVTCQEYNKYKLELKKAKNQKEKYIRNVGACRYTPTYNPGRSFKELSRRYYFKSSSMIKS